jgi:hypothetical protein
MSASSWAIEDEVVIKLRSLATSLDKMAGKVSGSAELGELPCWVVRTGGAFCLEAQELPQRSALKEVIAGSGSARVRAAAVLWLASGKNPDDLPAIEALLDSGDAAGSWPQVIITQRVMPSYPVDWTPLTLGQVALTAAGVITGREFNDASAYRSWRASQGDIKSSFEYWEASLQRCSHQERARRLDDLQRKNPELLVRVMLMGRERNSYGWDAKRLVAFVKRHVGDRLVELVQGKQKWPEFGDPARFANFASWTFDHWERLVGPAHGKVLMELFRKRDYPEEKWVRKHLALAAARAHPGQRKRILTAVLREAPTPFMAPVLKALATHHLKERMSVIAHWFHKAGSAADENRAAILEAIGNQGSRGRRALRRLILSSRFDGRNSIALVTAARRLGAKLDADCEKDMSLRLLYCKGGCPPKIIAENKTKQKARDAAARKCLSQVKIWLKKTSRGK